ncbi:MAG: PQ-loop domain-containing transporter [archaeon]|nr:PQ-loop domain-containing transporter [archaeon]
MMHQFIGWVGAFLFAICALPQVIKTWKSKKADDLSLLFLLFWLLGEFLTFAYIILDDIQEGVNHFPLYVNYFFNIILVLYLIYAKKYYK